MTVEQLAQKLVQFESTHENMNALRTCLDFCAQFFEGLPVHIERYEQNGIPSVVIQTKKTLEPEVILLGHIDTVPGKPELFEGRIESGKLYGRGTLDMKAFVATSMMVLKELVEEGCQRSVALMIVSDEELGGVYGANFLVNKIGYKAQTILVPDDGEHIQKIVSESKHILQLKFEAHGKESHAARPWAGDNAILKLFRTYSALASKFTHYQTEPEDIWVNTINLGSIEGGIATNEVPESAKMNVDIRFNPSQSREDILTWVEEVCEDGVTYEIGMEGYPTVVDVNDPVVQMYSQIIKEVTDREVEYVKHGGGTDGRYFAHKGMRVIVHQGTGGACQSDDEFVEIEALRQLVDIQKKFIRSQSSV